MFGLVDWFVCWRSPLVDLSVFRRRLCRCHRLVAASRSNDSSVCGWYSDGGQRWQTVIGDDVTPRVSGIADTSLRASLTDYHWRSGPRAGSLNPATPLDPQTLENEYSWVLNLHSTDWICFWFRNSILVRINNSNRLLKVSFMFMFVLKCALFHFHCTYLEELYIVQQLRENRLGILFLVCFVRLLKRWHFSFSFNPFSCFEFY
jgi:hypothetical protein